MIKARLALSVEHSLPIRLLAKNLNSHLVDFGLACLHRGVPNDIVAPDLPLAPGASDDVVILGRIVGKTKTSLPQSTQLNEILLFSAIALSPRQKLTRFVLESPRLD
jgi:hypothetical protein